MSIRVVHDEYSRRGHPISVEKLRRYGGDNKIAWEGMIANEAAVKCFPGKRAESKSGEFYKK